MKIVCAWCHETIRIACDHCGETLVPVSTVHYNFPILGAAMVCMSGKQAETALLYTVVAINRMKTSHGICQDCTKLTQPERDQLAREKRGPTGVPAAPTPTKEEGHRK